MTEKVAIIDVGSNSFRLIVITYTPGKHFQITDEVRESVRLVQGLGATGRLSPAAMDHAVEVMQLYATFCKANGITDIIAVATSAVREAGNGPEFVARVERQTGIRVRVLSGEEEAYYGYLAAVNSTTLEDGYVIDIGGGSLEITRVVGREHQEAVSLTLGAVRTTEDWLPHAPTSTEQIEKLGRYIRKQLAPHKWFQGRPGTRLIGGGGSLRNLARLAQKRHDYPMEELHGYALQRADLHDLVRVMAPLSVDGRAALIGMKRDRADIALAAAIVIDEVMRFGYYSELTVCSQGVREGLFYERYLPDAPHYFPDVRRASVLNIAHLYGFQHDHAQHVAHLSLSLFDQMAALTQDKATYGPVERELLWAACMLHDIGMTIDYNDHHRHSYYLILNSGLPGFSHRELALVALAAKYHRKGRPDLAELGPALTPNDELRLLRMTAILRLAEQLDRSRGGAVRNVTLTPQNGRLLLTPHSEADISVEVWSAGLHTDIFEAAFGRPLQIGTGIPTQP